MTDHDREVDVRKLVKWVLGLKALRKAYNKGREDERRGRRRK
jgi:hypothetical protein